MVVGVVTACRCPSALFLVPAALVASRLTAPGEVPQGCAAVWSKRNRVDGWTTPRPWSARSNSVTPDGTSENAVRPAPALVGIADEEKHLRQELGRRIADAAYPADRNALLRHLRPDEREPLSAQLRMLPPDVSFGSPEEALSAFGGMNAAPRGSG